MAETCAPAQTLKRLNQTASPINVATVHDKYDPDDNPVIENLIDDPELAAPGKVSARQLAAKWLTDASRTTSGFVEIRDTHFLSCGPQSLVPRPESCARHQ